MGIDGYKADIAVFSLFMYKYNTIKFLTLIIALLLIIEKPQLQAQRFTIHFKDSAVTSGNKIKFRKGKSSQSISIKIDTNSYDFKAITEIRNEFAVFKVLQTEEGGHGLYRLIEDGELELYDEARWNAKREKHYSRIHVFTRMIYRKKGDSIVSELRNKGFSKIFDSSFQATYPNYKKTKRKVTMLNTLGITAGSLLIGGDIAILVTKQPHILIGYTAATAGMNLVFLAIRRSIIKKVYNMAKDYNHYKKYNH